MHVITYRPVVAGGLPQEKKAIAAELGGQPREDSQILTFPLSKTSPGAYSPHRMLISILFYFYMHVMYCSLRIGSLDD
jgi:hypothetical protein